jgi:hypothetical protein
MTLASSPGEKRSVTLVMAGFTPNAVHPHGGRSGPLRPRGGVHSPATFGAAQAGSSQPPLPDCPSAGGKDTIPPPATESPGRENRPVTFQQGVRPHGDRARPEKWGVRSGLCQSRRAPAIQACLRPRSSPACTPVPPRPFSRYRAGIRKSALICRANLRNLGIRR